ncbi:MAG: hypothetical protein RL247_170 [Actinomycetota bacterium]
MTGTGKSSPSGDRRPRKPGPPKSHTPRSSSPGGKRPSGSMSGNPGADQGSRYPRGGDRRRSDQPGKYPDRKSAQDRTNESRASAPRHDDPIVDADVTVQELDRGAWRELKALTKENAEWVAGHLVMASRVVDEDPELAHRHALAAERRAGRIPVVRETVGITAYLIGDFALALRELRTYRRLSGSNDQVPMMVDCERGLGRPQKALELAGEVNRRDLDPSVAVELAIARSGARMDLGQLELALQELDIPQLNPQKVFSYSPALFDSYATILSELGRVDEASRWGDLANRAAEALALKDHGDGDEVVVIDTLPEGDDA